MTAVETALFVRKPVFYELDATRRSSPQRATALGALVENGCEGSCRDVAARYGLMQSEGYRFV